MGIFLRLPPALFVERAPLHFLEILHPQPGFTGVGFDENLYREYVKTLSQAGLSSYPDLAEGYVNLQARLPSAILPPTRFLYIFCAYLWHQTTGADALAALKNISSLFSILTLVLTAIFPSTSAASDCALVTSALMAFAPTQIHMSQHALIDGVFACVALACLWLLWENLQRPNDLALARRLWDRARPSRPDQGKCTLRLFRPARSFGASYWFRIGILTRFLLATTLVGPLLGVAILVNLCGSLGHRDPHLSLARKQGRRSAALRPQNRGRTPVSLPCRFIVS